MKIESGVRRAQLAVITTTVAAVLFAGCSSSGTTPLQSSGCPLTVDVVSKALGHPATDLKVAATPQARCGFAAPADESGSVQIQVIPFPQKGSPKTLDAMQQALRRFESDEPAAVREPERIVDQPAWGSGDFVDVSLQDSPAQAESIRAFTQHWELLIVLPATRLLAGDELSWTHKLVAGLEY